MGPQARPLVRRLGLQELINREPEKPPEPTLLEEDTWTALAGHVRAAWGRNKLAKMNAIDLKLLACLRARRGVYSAAQLSQMQNNGGLNIVWADLTETKCRAGSAWIREVILPVGDQPWGLDTTPIPDLPMPMKKAIATKALQKAIEVMTQAQQVAEEVAPGGQGPAGAGPGGAMGSGGIPSPGAVPMSREEFHDLAVQIGEKMREDAEKVYQKEATKRAKKMERQIADRLAEGGFQEAIDGFIEDFVTYPAAILKGPMYRRRKSLKWGEGWKPKVGDNPVQTWDRVSPFDAYPAPSSKSPQEGDFIERVRFRREELHALKGLPGYQDAEIDQALRDYSNGHLEGWLWTESERQRLENETRYLWLSPPGVIDALNYWGSVPGWKLMSYGVPDLEDTKEYECNILICGRYVLYAALNTNPLGARPYRKACYDEIPGAFWGRSIPDLASTSQKMCNAIACAMADNMSIASGPQAWVHMDRLADGEQSMELFPWKVWQLKSDPTQGVNPGIGFFQPDDRAAHLMNIYDQWETKADDATGIPRYTYGNEKVGGAGNTMGGLSMLMNSAAKGLRRAIGSIDMHVIAPTIYDTFVNEMLYNPDDSIKGDNIVVPRGAAAILIRESAQQRRTQFLAMTANPIDSQVVGVKQRAALLRATAESLELPVDEVVPTDEEIEEMLQQQAASQEAQLAAAQEAEIGKIRLEHELDMEKEDAISKRESASKKEEMVTDIIRQTIEKTMQSTADFMKQNAPKRLKYQYDDKGDLVGGELE